ncbi:CU044_5270 family protein [Plantactinospora solaniradicis]|uniref:CU044_5270 family protein n=1 Tax=Plantactinospora solaniradicis TaxID=1723736 RepID=A0ABW1KIP5_9ACTN
MNDLDLMTEFRAELAPAHPEAMARARARLLTEAAPPVPALVSRTRRAWPAAGWSWQLVPAGGLVLALAVGLVAVGHGIAGSDVVGSDVAGSDVAGPPVSTLDAGTVLRLAAAQARQTPAVTPRSDQFVYVESVVAFHGYDADGRYIPPVRKHRQSWTSVDGTRDGWLDEKAYDPGHQGRPDLHLPLEASCRESGPGCVPAYLDNLPTDRDGMRAYLAANGPDDSPLDPWMFRRVGDLIQEGYVPPRSLAALFEATATIPGVVVLPNAVDPAGRRGVAVAMTADGFRTELIFDAKTHEYLGAREVKVSSREPTPATSGQHLWPPPGPRPEVNEVVGEVARTRIAIVDRARQLP